MNRREVLKHCLSLAVGSQVVAKVAAETSAIPGVAYSIVTPVVPLPAWNNYTTTYTKMNQVEMIAAMRVAMKHCRWSSEGIKLP